jgi:hypothetical protein
MHRRDDPNLQQGVVSRLAARQFQVQLCPEPVQGGPHRLQRARRGRKGAPHPAPRLRLQQGKAGVPGQASSRVDAVDVAQAHKRGDAFLNAVQASDASGSQALHGLAVGTCNRRG